MKLIEQQEIMNTFHDGTIIAICQNKDDITISIEIEYLAAMLHESFVLFYLTLQNCTVFSLNAIEESAGTITDFDTIIDFEPEILSCDITNDNRLSILCACNSDIYNNLIIQTDSIEINDSDKNRISVEKLNSLSDIYWQEWENNNS